jgi:hypothetical protein
MKRREIQPAVCHRPTQLPRFNSVVVNAFFKAKYCSISILETKVDNANRFCVVWGKAAEGCTAAASSPRFKQSGSNLKQGSCSGGAEAFHGQGYGF